jgi:hypothetical protein
MATSNIAGKRLIPHSDLCFIYADADGKAQAIEQEAKAIRKVIGDGREFRAERVARVIAETNAIAHEAEAIKHEQVRP